MMKAEVVELLMQMSVAMRRRGQAGKAAAYQRAARAIAKREDLEELVAKGRLRTIDGIGESVETAIVRYIQHGERPAWLPAPEAPEGPPVTPSTFVAPESYHEAPFAGVPDLHVHTTWSDGEMTVDEVAAYAKILRIPIIGISDHSGSLRIARGLDPIAVRAQWADIARVQKAHPDLIILKGTECDILRDGTLDHPAELLGRFDYVIASLHTNLDLPEAEQTERVLRALDHPSVTIMGHPTTRVPGRRAPAAMDLRRVFERASARNVALEINGASGRLDLDAGLAREALETGARIALGSDAHAPDELLGLERARRMAAEAGATVEQIANFDYLGR